ncbi:MAG: hypothetical protein ABSG90_02465 [Dehalococcoidia bacterium]
MESQFRCKCGNPVSSINQLCSECGSLGPHLFSGKTGDTAEQSRGSQFAARKDSYPAERVERREPPARFESSGGGEAVDIAPESSPRMRGGGGGSDDDDIRFPAGMRSRSPILDHIEDMGDDYDEKQSRKRRGKDSESEYEDDSEEIVDDEYVDEEQDEGEPQKKGMSVTAIVASIVLVLLLIAAAIYVYYNFDSLTAWLASPTVPETIKPSQ